MIEAVQNQSGLHAAILLCQSTGWIMRCPAADFLFTVVVMPIHVSLRWVHRDLIGPETRPPHRFQRIHIHAPVCLSFPSVFA